MCGAYAAGVASVVAAGGVDVVRAAEAETGTVRGCCWRWAAGRRAAATEWSSEIEACHYSRRWEDRVERRPLQDEAER